MSINRELSQLASFIDVQEDNNFIGISTGGTYTVGIGSSSVLIGTTGIITATQFNGPEGSSLIDHIDLQDEGSLVGTGFTTLNFVGAAVTITQGVTGVATITVDSAAVSGSDGQFQYNNGGSLGGTEVYYNDINDFVGIGTTNPTATLDLDGDLNVSGICTFQDAINLESNRNINFGNTNRNITSTGTQLVISTTGANDIKISANDSGGTSGDVNIKTGTDGGKVYLTGTGGVGIYHTDTGLKFETTGYGATVYGGLNVSGVSTFQSHVHLGDDDELRFGAGDDFKIVHDPDDCRFENSTGDIKFKNTGSYFFFDEDGGQTLASFINDGAANLFHGGSKKFETVGTGVSISSGTASTATIYGPGNLIIDPAPVDDNGGIVRIKGDLYVDGTTTEINSTTLTIDDLNVVVASGATNGLTADGAGLSVAGAGATIKYNYNGGGVNEQWVFNKAPYYNTDRLLTTADEGSGNGIDADTLDGQEGTHYLDYNNFTNTPTIPTVNDATLTLATSGDGISGSDTFTANQSTDTTFTVTVSSASTNQASTLVYRDASGGFSAGIVTATSFVKASNSGGFLKADGTEDTNTYLTSYTETQTLNDVVGLGSDTSQTITVGTATTGVVIRPDGTLNVSGIATAQDFNSASDESLKTNIRTIEDPLAKVVQIRGVNFDWKETQRPALGVIAQEVEKVLPELVTDNGTKTVNYNGLIGLLIETVKEQQKQIDTLSERLSKLE